MVVCVQDALKWLNKFNVTHAAERQHGVALGHDYLETWYLEEYCLLLQFLQQIGMRHGTCHCKLVVLARNRTIRAYVVVVILNATSWLSAFLCYHGYKPAYAQQAPLWEGLRRQRKNN